MEKTNGDLPEKAASPAPAWRAIALHFSLAAGTVLAPSPSRAETAGKLQPENGYGKLVVTNHETMSSEQREKDISGRPAPKAAETARQTPVEETKAAAAGLKTEFESGRADFFTASYEGAMKEFRPALENALKKTVENIRKDLEKQANGKVPENSTAAQAEEFEAAKAAAKVRLEQLKDRQARGFSWNAAAIFAAFVEGQTYGGAAISFKPEHVNPWVDEHLRVGLGAGRDGAGNLVPGLAVSVVYGKSGERFGWDAGAGTVNGLSAGIGGDVRMYLNNRAVDAAAAEGEAKARKSVMVGAGISTSGAAVVAGYRVETKEGVDRETEIIRRGLAELLFQKDAAGVPAIRKIADLENVKIEEVPSLDGKKDAEKLLTGLKEISRRILAAYAYDSLEEGPQAYARASAVQEISQGKRDEMMNQVLGWHFGSVFVGFGTQGLVVGGSLERDSGTRAANLPKKAGLEDAVAGGYNRETATAESLWEKYHVKISEKTGKDGEKFVELSRYGSQDVRVDMPAGMEDAVRVNSRVKNDNDGMAPKVTVTLSAEKVKAVSVTRIAAGAGDVDQIIIRINPDEPAAIRLEAARANRGAAALRGKMAGKGDFSVQSWEKGEIAGSAGKGLAAIALFSAEITNSNAAEYEAKNVVLGLATDFKGSKDKGGDGSYTRPEDDDKPTGGGDAGSGTTPTPNPEPTPDNDF